MYIPTGYFVRREDGSPYRMHSLTIEFCMLDPTNPSAVRWMKSIIEEQLLQEAGASGWMCDFGAHVFVLLIFPTTCTVSVS